MIVMNLFKQEQDESSEFQEDLRSKLSLSEMILQQWYEFKMMKMKLEMMRLEAQKLADQKELIKKDVSFQSLILTLNKSSASIYWWDKIDIFHKYVAFRASKLIFKLKDQNNYNN